MTYRLHLVEYPREAPKIVLLHGLGGSHRYWNTGLHSLRGRYHVIMVDLLGFGDSDKPWMNYTKERHLQALENTLREFDCFVLIGHSLGAALALAYGVRNQHQVIGEVLISLPYFPTEKKAYKWFRRTPSGWLMTNILTAVAACLFTRWVIARFLPRMLTEYPREVAEDLLKHNVMSSTTTLWQVLYNSTIASDAHDLDSDICVLCIHSSDDDTAPYNTVRPLVEYHYNWELETFRNCSHHPWLRDNKSCVAKVHDHYTKCLEHRPHGIWKSKM